MTAPAEGQRAPKQILRDLRRARVKIEAGRDAMEDQTRLVIEGSNAGLQPAEMARAADPESGKALRESFGQIIRKERDNKPRTRGKKAVAK